MEIDLEDAQGSVAIGHSLLQAEVCVVGGGIAGLVLAQRLTLLGVDVILLEAGGKHPGFAGRDRALGGTSLRWGGQLLPLPDQEGWPLPAGALDRYWPEVEALFGTDDLPYSSTAFLQAVHDRPQANLTAGQAFTPRFAKFAPFHRRNLGSTLGRQLTEHTRTRVLLHAQAEAVGFSADGSRAVSVQVRQPSGKRLTISAAHIVLAAGTFATCRLLLALRAVTPQGIGKVKGLVGQSFHDHATVTMATFDGPARKLALRWGHPWLIGGLRGTVHSLKLEAAAAMRSACGGHHAMAHFTFEEPANSPMAELRELLRGRQMQGGSVLQHLGTLARGSSALLRTYHSAVKHERRYLSPQAKVNLRLNVALTLDVCADDLDPHLLEHRDDPASRGFTAIAHEAVPASARAVCRALERRGFSAKEGAHWNQPLLQQGSLEGLEDARHAMGGAPMGTDPRSSVVSPELAVHGVSNLYVASAAVLPDGRAQLPTMTLIALSLRLADHLVRELAR